MYILFQIWDAKDTLECKGRCWIFVQQWQNCFSSFWKHGYHLSVATSSPSDQCVTMKFMDKSNAVPMCFHYGNCSFPLFPFPFPPPNKNSIYDLLYIYFEQILWFFFWLNIWNLIAVSHWACSCPVLLKIWTERHTF